MLVGDAPGADDDRSGRAFSGPAGALWTASSRSIGLDRDDLLLTTLVPWRPPGGRPLTEAEMQACLPFLLPACSRWCGRGGWCCWAPRPSAR